jgi:hypothetical protein
MIGLMLLATFSCLSSSCAPTVVDKMYYEDGQLMRVEERERSKGNDETRGKVVEYYRNGAKSSESALVDGDRHGTFRGWYRSGQLRERGRFESGEQTGTWTYYFPNGQLRTRGTFASGRRTGTWTFHTMDGQPHARLTYTEQGLQRENLVEPPEVESAETGHFCDKRSVRAVVSANAPAIEQCFERLLRRDRQTGGKVLTSYRIVVDGSVESADTETLEGKFDPDFHGCVAQIVERMQYPPTSGGVCVINYPLVFTPIEASR